MGLITVIKILSAHAFSSCTMSIKEVEMPVHLCKINVDIIMYMWVLFFFSHVADVVATATALAGW